MSTTEIGRTTFATGALGERPYEPAVGRSTYGVFSIGARSVGPGTDRTTFAVFVPGGRVLRPEITRGPIVIFSRPDNAPPVVSNFLPTLASAISPTTAISFDVIDDSGLFTRVIVTATQADHDTGLVLSEELVYNGGAFATRYSGSNITSIAGGYHVVIRRTGGWLGNLTINTYAIDRGGNEAS